MTGRWKPWAFINVCEKQLGWSLTVLRPVDKMSSGSLGPLGALVLPQCPLHPAPCSSLFSHPCSHAVVALRAETSLCPRGVQAVASEEGLGASTEETDGGLAHSRLLPACHSGLLQAHAPSCVVGPVSCILLVSSVDCKGFLFLSYVFWCYGIFIPLVTKPSNNVFIVTYGFLWTMQWFILKPLVLSGFTV